jgi:hypothetical protein
MRPSGLCPSSGVGGCRGGCRGRLWCSGLLLLGSLQRGLALRACQFLREKPVVKVATGNIRSNPAAYKKRCEDYCRYRGPPAAQVAATSPQRAQLSAVMPMYPATAAMPTASDIQPYGRLPR